jgi:hypothetical protein
VTTRITQRTRTSGWQSSFAASSASTFSISTSDPSLSVMMAPMPTLMLAFGGKSGFRPMPMRPLSPQRPPPAPPSADTAAPDPVPETGAADLPAGSSAADLPTEGVASELVSEDGAPDMTSDSGAPRPRAGRHLRLLDPPEAPSDAAKQEAAKPAEPEAPSDGAEHEAGKPTELEAVKPAHPNRLEMTIDSLPHHDLTEPIPIAIDPLGDKVFTASVLYLDIAATGNSIGEALVLLKEQIEFVYGDLNRRSNRSSEQKTMLQMLQTYVAPKGTKPEWL